MLSSRNTIYTLILDLNARIHAASLEAIREISPLNWIFIFKKQSEKYTLLLCLKPPLVRFHLLSKYAESYETPLTKNWQSKLQQTQLKSIEMENNDRILKMSFQNHYSVVFELFPQKPNLYLLDKNKIILSNYLIPEETYTPPRNIKEKEPLQEDLSITHKLVEKIAEEQEKEQAFNKLRKEIHNKIQQKIKNNYKALEKCLAALKTSQNWHKIQHEGVLLQANLYRLRKGMADISLTDWENDGKEITLNLDPLLTPNEIIAARFKIARKLKNGLAHGQKALEKLHDQSTKWNAAAAEFEKISSYNELEPFSIQYGLQTKPKQDVKIIKALPYLEFKSASGIPIWVGKNGPANDKLTFSYAKGSDWWLHVNNYPGSHVIIRVPKAHEPDEETLKDAFQLAIAYSKAKDKGEAEICLTQCKHISRLGKYQPGKVQISRHKNIYVKFDPQRFESIKMRPDQVKEKID